MKITLSILLAMLFASSHAATTFSFFSKTDISRYFVKSNFSGATSDATVKWSSATSQASATFQGTVTAINAKAFAKCADITSFTVPASVKTIGKNAFNGCGNLATLAFENNSQLATIDTMAFYECRSLASLSLPASVRVADYGAFYKCSSLTSLTLNANLTRLGRAAFGYCKMQSVTLPGSLKEIEAYAFYACEYLSSVTFNEGLTSIGERAFNYCNNLINVTLPASLRYIGNMAFYLGIKKGNRPVVNFKSPNVDVASVMAFKYYVAKTTRAANAVESLPIEQLMRSEMPKLAASAGTERWECNLTMYDNTPYDVNPSINKLAFSKFTYERNLGSTSSNYYPICMPAPFKVTSPDVTVKRVTGISDIWLLISTIYVLNLDDVNATSAYAAAGPYVINAKQYLRTEFELEDGEIPVAKDSIQGYMFGTFHEIPTDRLKGMYTCRYGDILQSLMCRLYSISQPVYPFQAYIDRNISSSSNAFETVLPTGVGEHHNECYPNGREIKYNGIFIRNGKKYVKVK